MDISAQQVKAIIKTADRDNFKIKSVMIKNIKEVKFDIMTGRIQQAKKNLQARGCLASDLK